MSKNLCLAALVISLIGSMPAFASAGVDADQVQNEVIPMTMSTERVSCPQLDFGHKIIEKALSVQEMYKDFTASINSIIWNVKVFNAGYVDSIHSQNKDKTKKFIEPTLQGLQKEGCHYSILRDGKLIKLSMNIKPSVDEERRARHIQKVRQIVQQVKAAGVVTRADFLSILNEVMP